MTHQPPQLPPLRFTKKSVTIEAFRMTQERRMDNSEWPEWLHVAWNKNEGEPGALFRQSMDATLPDLLCIQTLEGVHLVQFGDWIIQGVKGELYPCKPDIFEATYSPAQQAALSSQAPADERVAFEAWAEARGYQRDELGRCRIGIVGPAYYNPNTEMAWQAWQARAALQSRQPAAPAEQEPYTTIDMGHGKWEVGAGKNAGLPCIAFGRNGTGKVGEPITTEPRQMSVEETFAVITFANVDGLDVLQDKMDQVREEFFPGTVCQFSQPAAPVAPVAAVPDALEVPDLDDWATDYSSGFDRGQAMGWNACRDLVIAASPTPPVQPGAGFVLVKKSALEARRVVFQAGRDSYQTPCAPMNTDEEAWEEFSGTAAQAEGGEVR